MGLRARALFSPHLNSPVGDCGRRPTDFNKIRARNTRAITRQLKSLHRPSEPAVLCYRDRTRTSALRSLPVRRLPRAKCPGNAIDIAIYRVDRLHYGLCLTQLERLVRTPGPTEFGECGALCAETLRSAALVAHPPVVRNGPAGPDRSSPAGGE